MVAAAAAAVLGSSVWWMPALLSRSSYFAVRQVEVVGARYLAPEDITRRLGLPADASVWLRLGRLEDALRASPGLADVSISRRLPGTLVVEVVERLPVALADGPAGLVAIAEDGTALPYDPSVGPVDAPLIGRPDTIVVRSLALIHDTEPELFAAAVAARLDGGLALELNEGRIRLDAPVSATAVQAVEAVRRDLAERGLAWREVDGRFAGWVVVRPVRAAADSGAR